MPNRSEVVIDADGHICEPEIVWTQYTQAKYRDRVLQIRTAEGQSRLFMEGHLGAPGAAQACIPGGMEPGRNLTWADILPGSYDPKARLDVLDAEGIDQALLFPSVYLLYGDVRDPEVAAETCRASWMVRVMGFLLWPMIRLSRRSRPLSSLRPRPRRPPIYPEIIMETRAGSQ